MAWNGLVMRYGSVGEFLVRCLDWPFKNLRMLGAVHLSNYLFGTNYERYNVPNSRIEGVLKMAYMSVTALIAFSVVMGVFLIVKDFATASAVGVKFSAIGGQLFNFGVALTAGNLQHWSNCSRLCCWDHWCVWSHGFCMGSN